MFDRSSSPQFRLLWRLRLRDYCGNVPALKSCPTTKLTAVAALPPDLLVTEGARTRRASSKAGSPHRPTWICVRFPNLFAVSRVSGTVDRLLSSRLQPSGLGGGDAAFVA